MKNYIYIGGLYHISKKEVPSDYKFGITSSLNVREYSLNSTKMPVKYRMLKAWEVPENMKREDIEDLVSVVFSKQKYEGCEWYNIDLEEFYTKITDIINILKKSTNNDYYNLIEVDLKLSGYETETIENILNKTKDKELQIEIEGIKIEGLKAIDKFGNFVKYILENNKVELDVFIKDWSNIFKENKEDFKEYERAQLFKIGDMYLNCHNDLNRKKNIIDRISDKYGLDVICNVVKPNQ
jgi:hypothetical protein